MTGEAHRDEDEEDEEGHHQSKHQICHVVLSLGDGQVRAGVNHKSKAPPNLCTSQLSQ